MWDVYLIDIHNIDELAVSDDMGCYLSDTHNIDELAVSGDRGCLSE